MNVGLVVLNNNQYLLIVLFHTLTTNGLFQTVISARTPQLASPTLALLVEIFYVVIKPIVCLITTVIGFMSLCSVSDPPFPLK